MEPPASSSAARMTRRDRLMRTLRGEPVDRPAVNFYELDAYNQDPHDPDPYNVFTDASWQPLLDLTRAYTDRIAITHVPFIGGDDPLGDRRARRESTDNAGRRHTETTIQAADRALTMRTRQDPDVFTVWTTEHLLKTPDDLRAWLALPAPADIGRPDPSRVLAAEQALGESGIAMIDVADPLCTVAELFDMATYTVIALRETGLLRAALDKVAALTRARVEAIATVLPGRLWRIVGPEYAAPPYLPPRLFREYVTGYDTALVAAIQAGGGYARLHSHGRLAAILDDIVATGCDALDPLEPPPQGDVQLADVRARHGEQLVLLGNLEIADIEQLAPEAFRPRVRRALDEGTRGRGRGFVLMPSACPYGRKLARRTLANYEVLVDEVTR